MRYRILCLLLLIVILLLADKSYETWTRPMELTPENMTPGKPMAKTDLVQATKTPPSPLSVEPVVLISEKNMFHPERRDFPIPMTVPGGELAKETKKPPLRPQIILYGVTVAEHYQSAIIAHTGRPLQKGEREAMTIKIGDRIGDYRLARILPDRIVMQGAEDSFEVLIDDPKTPRRRSHVKTENRPATITGLVPSPAPGPVSADPPKPIPPREPSRETVSPPPPAMPRPAPMVSPSPQPPLPSSSAPRRELRPVYPSGISPRPETPRSPEERGP